MLLVACCGAMLLGLQFGAARASPVIVEAPVELVFKAALDPDLAQAFLAVDACDVGEPVADHVAIEKAASRDLAAVQHSRSVAFQLELLRRDHDRRDRPPEFDRT